MTRILSLILWLAAGLLILLAFWPQLDLIVSGWFYRPGRGFPLDHAALFVALHRFGTQGAWILGIVLALGLSVCFLWRRPVFGLDRKAWFFLLAGLLLGPGLLANVILKDHWGRARPHQVTEFGGPLLFSPYYAPQPQAHKNGSFIAGDPAFGFYLPSFAYVTRSRRYPHGVFWGGMAVGCLLGFARLAMGGHFLSDVLCAGLFILAVTAALHAALYGPRATKDCWRSRMGLNL